MFDPRALRRFRKSRSARVGSMLLVLLVGFALLGPLMCRHAPNESDFARGLDGLGRPVGPNAAHLLGVDGLLRDVLSRLAYGARISLSIAVLATALSTALGGILGMISGMARGTRARLLDMTLMRVVDVGLSFPYLLLVMAVGGALGQTTLLTVLLVLGFTSWFGTARIVRGKTLQVHSLDFVVAARALGQTSARILFAHVLPNVAGPLIVLASGSAANMILAEAVLSYLELGLPPPTPSWGRMLYEGQRAFLVAPWLVLAPGALIVLSVLGFNLLGEGLRDAFDPREGA